jgi:hypothetical protein
LTKSSQHTISVFAALSLVSSIFVFYTPSSSSIFFLSSFQCAKHLFIPTPDSNERCLASSGASHGRSASKNTSTRWTTLFTCLRNLSREIGIHHILRISLARRSILYICSRRPIVLETHLRMMSLRMLHPGRDGLVGLYVDSATTLSMRIEY